MQDRFLKQKIFGTMGCVAITLLCVLFYMFGRSMLDEQKEKELRAKETLESVRSRLDLCHSQLQRHSSDIGQT
ncbi:Protein isoform 1, partial [Diplonema papillatum]